MEDLLTLQTSIRTIEGRLDHLDRALQALRIVARGRFDRITAAFASKNNPQRACSSPFTKRLRGTKSPLKSRPQSPCLFMLPRASKREQSLSRPVKRSKQATGWVSFGGEAIEEEDREEEEPRDEYQMSDNEDDIEHKGKYTPLWALDLDLQKNEELDPDLIFAPRSDDLSDSRKVGFSCHLEMIFPSVTSLSKQRSYFKRGDSANWDLTNL